MDGDTVSALTFDPTTANGREGLDDNDLAPVFFEKPDEDVVNAATSAEASAAYLVPPALAAVIDDAKVLWLSFHMRDPERLLDNTWGIKCASEEEERGDGDGGGGAKPCALELFGKYKHRKFSARLTAYDDGTWVVQNNSTPRPKPKRYGTLHALLAGELPGLFAAGKHALPPQAGFVQYVDGGRPSKELDVASVGVWRAHQVDDLSAPDPGGVFTITPAPYPQPHVVLGTLVTEDHAEYAVGYHPATKSYFLTDPRAEWARVSYSLPALVSTLSAPDA